MSHFYSANFSSDEEEKKMFKKQLKTKTIVEIPNVCSKESEIGRQRGESVYQK